MKRVALLFVVFFITLFTPRPTLAACRMLSPGQTCGAGQFPRTYNLTDGGSAQCTSGTSGQYSVCCDFESEANTADSVRAPICGSSQELGKANSSCWTCGGDLRCAGLSFGLEAAKTDPFITQTRNPVVAGDTNMDQVWRVPGGAIPADGFTYNGIHYDKPGGDLIVCNANVLGCGASDVSCTSALFPNEDITDEVTDDPNAGKPKQDTPDAHFGTIDGPDTKIAMTPGKNPGQSIPIESRTVQIFAGTGLINVIPIYNFFARIYYNKNQHRFDDLRELGGTVEYAMKYPLLPYVKQQEYRPAYWGEKLATNQAPWDTGYRFCAPDGKIARSDGTEKDNIPLEGLAKSRLYIGEGDPVDDKYYYNALTGLRFLTAINTTFYATLPSTDFFTPTRDIVPIKGTKCLDKDCEQVKYLVEEADLEQALYPCSSQTTGATLPPTQTRAAGVAEKGSPGGALGNFLVNIIGEKLIGRRKACNEKDKNNECADTSVFLQPTDSQAGGVWLGCAGNGCTSTELADASSEEISQLLKDSGADPTNPQSKGGAWNAYWPLALRSLSEKFHGNRKQNEVLNNRSDERQSNPFWTGSAVAAFDCIVKGMIMPKTIQDERNYSCYYTESAISRQHGSADVPEEISRAVAPTWPSEFQEGILGKDFLEKQYKDRLNLITTQLTEEQRARLMTKIQGLINTYVTNGAWPNSGLANPDYQRQIHDAAQDYGINEAFLYALWIEETHASSVGDYPFGCGGYTDFSSSLNCVANDPTVQTYIRDPLPDALCMYADGHRGCTFEAHPNFVRNLMYYYDTLTNP